MHCTNIRRYSVVVNNGGRQDKKTGGLSMGRRQNKIREVREALSSFDDVYLNHGSIQYTIVAP